MTFGIQVAGRFGAGEVADERDGIAADGDIPFVRSMTGTVIDHAVADDGVVVRFGLARE